MANLNKVFLIGNLTRDPELRYIPNGTAVATFTVAAGRVYTSSAGERKEDTCFVRVVSWARQAELCGEFLSKGSPVFVEGRLQSRSWETPEGQKRSMIEVVAQSVQFLGRLPRGAAPPLARGADRGAGQEAGGAEKGAEPAGAQGPMPEEAPAGAEVPELPPEGEHSEGQLGEVPF